MDTTQSHLRAAKDRPAIDRRRFLLSLAWGGLSVAAASVFPAMLRFLWPRERGAGRDVVDVGALQDYRTSTVTTRWVERHGLWLVHRDGRLIALETRCTHLGCTPRWMADAGVFRCPCHGSRFSPDGVPINGPATQPLYRFAIRTERGQVVVDRSMRAAMDVAEEDARYYVRL